MRHLQHAFLISMALAMLGHSAFAEDAIDTNDSVNNCEYLGDSKLIKLKVDLPRHYCGFEGNDVQLRIKIINHNFELITKRGEFDLSGEDTLLVSSIETPIKGWDGRTGRSDPEIYNGVCYFKESGVYIVYFSAEVDANRTDKLGGKAISANDVTFIVKFNDEERLQARKPSGIKRFVASTIGTITAKEGDSLSIFGILDPPSHDRDAVWVHRARLLVYQVN